MTTGSGVRKIYWNPCFPPSARSCRARMPLPMTARVARVTFPKCHYGTSWVIEDKWERSLYVTASTTAEARGDEQLVVELEVT